MAILGLGFWQKWEKSFYPINLFYQALFSPFFFTFLTDFHICFKLDLAFSGAETKLVKLLNSCFYFCRYESLLTPAFLSFSHSVVIFCLLLFELRLLWSFCGRHYIQISCTMHTAINLQVIGILSAYVHQYKFFQIFSVIHLYSNVTIRLRNRMHSPFFQGLALKIKYSFQLCLISFPKLWSRAYYLSTNYTFFLSRPPQNALSYLFVHRGQKISCRSEFSISLLFLNFFNL